METVTRRVRLHPAQAEYRRSPARYRAFVGGRGAGKTWCGAYDLLRRLRPGGTYLIGSPTGVLMGDTTYPAFKGLAESFGCWGGVRLTPYPTATVLLDGGTATVRFRTAEDPERMRGPNLLGAWLDEASLMTHDAYRVVIGSLRDGGQVGWLGATFTPRGPTHWTHDTFATGRPDTHLVRCPTAGNPFLDPEFVATVRRQYGGGQYARQELDGEFVSLEGAEWGADVIDAPGRWFSDWPERVVATVVALDPSKGQREDSDYQAFVVARLSDTNTIYVDCLADRGQGVTPMIARGIDLCRRYRPDVFVVEDNDGLGMLVTEFRRQLQQDASLVPLLPVRNFENKVYRIRLRVNAYLNGRHPDGGAQLRVRETDGGRLLVGQMRDFPLGENDDCLDALELALRGLGDVWEQKLAAKRR